MIFVTVFIVVCIVIILALGICLYILASSKGEEEILKGAFCFNLMAGYSNNHAYGIEKKVQRGRGKRWVIDYIPLDVDPDVVGKIKEERVIVGRDKRLVLTPGELSSEKTIVIYLSPEMSDLSESFKKTIFGKRIMEKINDVNSDVEEKDLLEKQIDTQGELLTKTKGMGLVKEGIAQMEELFKDIKSLFREKEDKKLPFYNRPPGEYGGR